MKKALKIKKIIIKTKKREESLGWNKVVSFLKESGVKCVKNSKLAEAAIIIGGDGSILHWQSRVDCPLLGIKERKEGVGYYTKASLGDFQKKIVKILEGRENKDYYIHKLSMVEARLNGKALHPALNEYLISSGYARKMFNCIIKIGKKNFFERNSGIIAYTPTGSNAFAGSAHAERMEWNSEKIGLAALAPYSGKLKKGGMFFDSEKILIKCLDDKGEICIDGQKSRLYSLRRGDVVTIQKSKEKAKIIGFSPSFV